LHERGNVKMKKPKVFLLAALLLAVPAFVAWSGSGACSAESVTTISFLDVMPSPERTALFHDLITEFEAGHPTIKVEYTSVPWEEAYKKLVAMGASQTLPDIITCDVGILQSLAKPGWLLNLDKQFNSLPFKDDLTVATLASKDSFSAMGKVYAIPDGYLCQGIFVRTDWLADAGYKLDDLRHWTWDQYFEVNKKLTDPSKNRFGCAFRGGPNGGLRFFEYLGSMLEVTSAFPNGNDKSIYSDPRAVDYFKKFYSLYTDGYAPKDSINWGFKEMVQGFVDGQCGTLNQTPEVTVTCQKEMVDGTWTVLPQPVNPNAKKTSFVWGYSGAYAISAHSKNAKPAWTFIEWLSSSKTNLEYSTRFGCLPIYKSGLKDPFFQKGVMKGYADALLDPNIQYLKQPNELSQWGYFLAEYNKNEVQKYMAGQQTAEQTMANLSKWMTDQYDKDVLHK